MNNDSLNKHQYQYDVCFSFSGNERGYVQNVANLLKNSGVRIFYDEFAEAGLWGKDLYEHFANIYSKSSRYCVIFISKSYSERLWTNHERRNAQERAFRENSEYILPARFDNTEIPGLRDTIGYIDLKKKTPEEFAYLIIEKIVCPVKVSYFPVNPNVLYSELEANSSYEKNVVCSIASQIFESLKMTTLEERRLLYDVFLNGCPGEFPDNIHINAKYIQKIAGFSLKKY
ncbi:TIR domain-containing protein [Desulfomicrobium norvegicum]|uniref:TIR domain-containing protein n=1 Tax=Desulfomicrobium norvegicum (strain DSM 1741 / NCIMB 8310) TaxID=52561 RepID=A0A8G2FER5_DESNO|nr:TIR domain-containing protein [Desulfomicrobium norvegicum]SFL83889.1 TIR domain-containing protein [Desulfomicrobium norvegicum]